MSYKFHSDAAHGWLEVPLGDCEALGLKPSNFSRHSYREADTLYLEEDCDLSVFMNAYKTVKGESPEVIEGPYVQDSPIREMERVQPHA